ncbi:MAG TPA: RES family NAD+ phosphorylase [Verrucomicrobiae bacterium]
MTCQAYRIVQSHLVRTAFSGEGARLYGGRWNSPGIRVVYTAESRALAALEMLVHLSSEQVLHQQYSLIPIRFPSNLAKRLEELQKLPANWNAVPAPLEPKLAGDRWVTDHTTSVLSVPSTLIPSERNYLLNPDHPDFSKIEIGRPERFVFDERLAKRLKSD